MASNDVVQRAQQTVRTVLEVHRHLVAPASASLADRIVLALLRAALDDAHALTLLLGQTDRSLIGPASTLLRPLTDKLKRAAWAMAANEKEVETAFAQDKFPGANRMVETIEAKDPSHTLFTRLFGIAPSVLNGFVHGGSDLIKPYLLAHIDDTTWQSRISTSLAEHVSSLAIEAGLAAAELMEKYDPNAALHAAEQVSALVR